MQHAAGAAPGDEQQVDGRAVIPGAESLVKYLDAGEGVRHKLPGLDARIRIELFHTNCEFGPRIRRSGNGHAARHVEFALQAGDFLLLPPELFFQFPRLARKGCGRSGFVAQQCFGYTVQLRLGLFCLLARERQFGQTSDTLSQPLSSASRFIWSEQ